MCLRFVCEQGLLCSVVVIRSGRGEVVVGISLASLATNAHSVLMSLRAIDDEATWSS